MAGQASNRGGRLYAFLKASHEDGTALVLAIALAAGFMGLWLKKVQMDLPSGFLSAARFLGRGGESGLSGWERLSFFRADLAIQLVIVPLLLAAFLRWLPRVARLPAAAATGAVFCLFYFFELESLGGVGRYPTADMVRDALLWSYLNPDSISDYISVGGALKLAGLLAVITALAIAGSCRGGRLRAAFVTRLVERSALAIVALGAVLSLAAFAVPIPDLAQHRSAVGDMVRALAPSEAATRIPHGASREQLLALYRSTARLSDVPAPGASRGRDAGHDVLLFVIETGPKASHDPLRDLGALPGMRALVDRSFVADDHYSTYPYTSDAVFSILTGMYPIGRRAFLRDRRPLPDVGLIPPLKSQGYTGLAYMSIPDSFEEDERMYALAGVSRYFIADPRDEPRYARALDRARRTLATLPKDSPARTERGGLFARRLTSDYMALDALREDITRYKRAGRRFVAIFAPQIGHAPWFNLYGRSSILERGRDLLRLQDVWLKEIVDLLATNGWLDETVIVVTADHGIRTRIEDPALEAGTISGYSFKVPLVIFAPGTLKARHEITAATSHIDIAPTLHELLGTTSRVVGQGVPIWDTDQLVQRRLFLFAAEYLGADAYSDDGKFVMRQSLTGMVYESPKLAFGPGTAVRQPAEAARLAEPIDAMYEIQPRLLEALR